MADTMKCAGCSRKRVGRYTRKKTDSVFDPPRWYCWNCLKAGQGTDEGQETVTQRVAASIPEKVKTGEAIEKSKTVLAAVPDIQAQVNLLVIDDEESYLSADNLLGRVRAAKAVWNPIWERIQEKTIKPIREGLEELYSLNREVEKPFVLLEGALKLKMKDYKLLEAKQIREKLEAQQREALRLQREAEEKTRAAAKAATPQLRGKLSAMAEKLTQRSIAVQEVEAASPVMGAASSTRTKVTWRINDIRKFCKAVGDGTLPDDCLLTNDKIMNQYFSTDPEGMKAWPGVEVYDDISIVGR